MAAKVRIRWHARRGYCVATSWVSSSNRAAETLAVEFAAALNRLNGVSLMLSRRHFPNVAQWSRNHDR